MSNSKKSSTFFKDMLMAQEKAQNLPAGAPHSLHRRLTRATKAAHGFVGVASNKNRGQFKGAEQRRHGHGVAAVCLDAAAGPRRNRRGRNDAVVPALSIPPQSLPKRWLRQPASRDKTLGRLRPITAISRRMICRCRP